MRLVRILKICFVASQILFLYFLVIQLPSPSTRPVDFKIEMALTILALSNVVLGFVIPRYFLRAGPRATGDASQQSSPIQRWFTANIVGFALLESCSLFGVVLHFLGAPLRHSELLICIATVAIVFFTAGAPPAGEASSNSQN